MINFKVKKLVPEAKLPQKTDGNIGWDLFCVEDELFWMYDYTGETGHKRLNLCPGESHTFRTGISIELPEGYHFLLWDRSGLAAKHDIHRLAGVIDNSYRGEILIHLINLSNLTYTFKEGDKIAQGIIQQEIPARLVEVTELSETDRGDKGFGSSGR